MRRIVYLFCVVALVGCGGSKTEGTSDTKGDSTLSAEEKSEVKVLHLAYSDFSKEILSNGKLMALRKADMRFKTSENISKLYFNNGDRISKGQVIATLDNFTLKNTLRQTNEQFERAKLELQDILIGQGYAITDSATIPKSTLVASRIKSGYDKAIADLEMAHYNLDNSEIKAPFDGIVANILLKENNLATPGDRFCTIIDNSNFEAEFTVLEGEMGSIHKGQAVKISPFAITDFEVVGEITQVNPVVDNNGMVLVKALCSNTQGMLAEGMNVRVVIEEKLAHQLVIPKQAIVLRSEKQVVFTSQDGLAKWNYVKTALENSTSFTIAEGLKAGDLVVLEGNMNLAHDAKVVVVQ